MDIQILTRFFMWCTILNFALMMFMFLMSAIGLGWVYQIHSKFFPVSRETFDVMVYGFFSFYKFVFFFFVVIPYAALLIIG